MKPLQNSGRAALFFGDLVAFVASLWLALFLRTLSAPSEELFLTHLVPFILLFAVWVVVFYISGLYEKHVVVLRSKLPSILLNAQIANAVIAIVFFYFIKFFGITPKTVLFIYLVVSFLLISYWRMHGYFALSTKRAVNALLIGSGGEMRELFEEVNNNPLYNIRFVSSIDLDKLDSPALLDEIVPKAYAEEVSLIVIDLDNEKAAPVLPHLYNLIFSKIEFLDMHKLYEDIFNRVPLSLLKYNWFLENISTSYRQMYDVLKRAMDIVIAVPLGLVSLVVYPFVYIAIKMEDKGPIFIRQGRIGQGNKPVNIIKFRSMTANDGGEYRGGATELKVTKVGAFLRKSRIDELPQLWNVIKGDISLIGPRPELPSLVKLYHTEIPYYNVRHLIKPGLSGWAQIYQEDHPHHAEAVLETKEKLSYDLYYIKNRSFLLDVKIALRTIKTLLSRAGI